MKIVSPCDRCDGVNGLVGCPSLRRCRSSASGLLSKRTSPVYRPVALALLLFLCACSSGNSDVPLPQAGVSGPGDGELLQAVSLDGRYIDSIRIASEGWESRAPGQEVTITFEAVGMAQVRQFEIVVKASPTSAFALDGAAFARRPLSLHPSPPASSRVTMVLCAWAVRALPAPSRAIRPWVRSQFRRRLSWATSPMPFCA